MNTFSDHYFRRYLTDEPWVVTDNYIQNDMGHRKRSKDQTRGTQVPEPKLTGQMMQ